MLTQNKLNYHILKYFKKVEVRNKAKINLLEKDNKTDKPLENHISKIKKKN